MIGNIKLIGQKIVDSNLVLFISSDMNKKFENVYFLCENQKIYAEVHKKQNNRFKVLINLKDYRFIQGKWTLIVKTEQEECPIQSDSYVEGLENCYFNPESNCFIRLQTEQDKIVNLISYQKNSDSVNIGKVFGEVFHNDSEKYKLLFYLKSSYDKQKKIYLTFWQTDLGLIYRIGVEMAGLEITADLQDFIKKFADMPQSRWKVYLEYLHDGIHCFDRIFSAEEKREEEGIYQDVSYRYLNFLGEIQKEEIPYVLLPYFTAGQRFSVVLLQKRDAYKEQFRANVEKFYTKNDTMFFEGSFPNKGFDICGFELRYRNKREEDALNYPLNYKIKNKRDYIKFKVLIDTKHLKLEQFYWDLFMVAEKNGDKYDFRLSNTSRFFKLKFYSLICPCDYFTEDGHVLYPYMTEKKNIALTYRKKEPYDCFAFRLKERFAYFLYILLKPYFHFNKIALVFEKFCVMAQDNAWYFFDYCMKNQGEQQLNKKIYYVMDPNAEDYKKVLKYKKRILDFLSLKHMIYLYAADLLVSTDTKFHAYAWKAKDSLMIHRLKRKKIVFLQHGVIALKQVHSVYKKGGNNSVNLFITSSDFEKNLIFNYFGYKWSEIVVTGLPRWDVLEDKSNALIKKEILLMPTWRNWLDDVEDTEFMQSNYYKNYMELLNSEKLSKILETNQIKLNFYIHPKFREYMNTFAVTNDKINLIPFGTEQLNILMMRCSMLITDYSSVCWDVFYQGKPVVFYQFDLDEYNETQGSYIDMEKDLFGERTTSVSELLSIIEKYVENDFSEKEKFRNRRKELYKYIDKHNSERICYEIKKRGW